MPRIPIPGYRSIQSIPLPGGYVNARMIKDNYKRQLAAEHEVTRLALKYIAHNTTLPMRARIEAQLRLSTMPNFTRMDQIRDRCIASGYSRSIQKGFRLCRQQFRQKALAGDLPGVRKATW